MTAPLSQFKDGYPRPAYGGGWLPTDAKPSAPLTVITREDAERSAAVWGEKARQYLDCMDAACESIEQDDNADRVAAFYAEEARKLAVYAATCGRIALDAKELGVE